MTALHPDTTTALTALVDHTATWLDKADLSDHATALRALPTIDTTTAIEHAGPVARAAMHAAYHRSGVTSWPDAATGTAAVHAAGGLALRLDALDPYPECRDPLRGPVGQIADWLWTASCYAAQES